MTFCTFARMLCYRCHVKFLLFQAYFFPAEKVLHLLVGVVMFMIVLISWIYEHHELIRLGTNKWYERRSKQRKSE